jgi:hypothetical protein
MMAMGRGGRLERALIWAVWLEFFALIVIHLCAIPVHISRSYNEGWNAYFAQIAIDGGVLYPSADSMLTNNYPPLSFYMVGAIGRMVGDNIVAGRLIAVLSLFVISTNVFGLSRWLGVDRKVAMLSSGVFLLGTYTLMPTYVAINDPQFLAYMFVISGALVFLKAKESSLWQSMMLSALLMTLGGLVKHSEISMPLTVCTWALFYDRRRFGVFLVCASFLLGVAAAGAYWTWGEVMVHSIFLGPRIVVIHRAMAQVRQDLPFLLPYLVLAVTASVLMRRSPQVSFILLYLAWSLFNGFWMLTGYGVSQNVMCDAVIALALASALFVMSMSNTPKAASLLDGRGRMIAILLMTLPCMGTSLFVYLSNPSLRDLGEILDGAKWQKLYSTLSRASGPVACETLAVCYWAKRPMEVDFFNYGQKIVLETVYVDAPNGFFTKISHKSYAYVVVETNFVPLGRLPPVLVGVLFKNYKPMDRSDKTELVFVPRS